MTSIGDDLDPTIGQPDDPELILDAKAYELFVDLDNKAAIKTFLARYRMLNNKLPFIINEWWTWQSKTKGHYHVVVDLSESLDFEQRLFLQLYLGSDPTKEFLSLIRNWEGYGEIIRFFLPGKKGTYAVHKTEGPEAPPSLIAADPNWEQGRVDLLYQRPTDVIL